MDHSRIRAALVIGQIGFVLLLIGAGLLIRSFRLLGGVDPGFHDAPERVVVMQVSPSGRRYEAPPPIAGERVLNRALINFWDELLARIRALPGVESVISTGWARYRR